MELNSPLVVSANPLSENIENIKKMEDAGASAVVMYSLFEEQLIQEQHELHHHTTETTDIFAEAQSYFPELDEYKVGPGEYLKHISLAKDSVSIPIIASLNGTKPGSWSEFALQMQNAGADAIELNIYNIPTDMDMTASQIEESYLQIIKSVKDVVTVPVAVKLSPYFTNIANFAMRVDELQTEGLVLFNRFFQPDIDLEKLEVVPNILLSHSSANRLPMRWIAILKNRINADLAATSGVHTGLDVAKLLMAGANVTMVSSAILSKGIGHIKTIKEELSSWMEEKEYTSVQQMIGSMCQVNTNQPKEFERAQFLKAITSYKI